VWFGTIIRLIMEFVLRLLALRLEGCVCCIVPFVLHTGIGVMMYIPPKYILAKCKKFEYVWLYTISFQTCSVINCMFPWIASYLSLSLSYFTWWNTRDNKDKRTIRKLDSSKIWENTWKRFQGRWFLQVHYFKCLEDSRVNDDNVKYFSQ